MVVVRNVSLGKGRVVMDDTHQAAGFSLSRRGLLRTATGVVVAGALLESVAGASAAPPNTGQIEPRGAQASDLTVTITPEGGAPVTFDATEIDFSQVGNTGSVSGVHQEFGPVQMTKHLDAVAPMIMQWCANSIVLPSIVVAFTIPAGPATISFTNARITGSSIAVKSAGNGVGLIDAEQIVTFTFTRIAVSVAGQSVQLSN